MRLAPGVAGAGLMAALALVPLRVAEAVEVLSQAFSVTDGVYALELEVRLAAPREAVWSVLTDYDRLGELNPAVTESRVERSTGGEPEVLTVIRGCVLFFCSSVARVERMQESAPARIVAITDPARSDLRQGRSDWRLSDEAGTTRLELTVALEPDFWVPPLLGRRALRRSLVGGTLDLLAAVEQRAGQPDRAP
ncbi:MAG: SRPBCC family protein [Gammaproteobacteria bacterium]|nr:SRPBCC family protein [Gammaproteobacteria bacterium]